MKTILQAVQALGISWVFGFVCGADAASQRPQVDWLAGGHPFGASDVRFLSDGRLLSAGAGLKLWDVSRCRLERTLSQPRVGDDALALGPGEAWVASMTWHPVRALMIRELPSGRETQRLPLGEVNLPAISLSASPDGTWLLGSADNGRILRWHVPSGEVLPPLQLTDLRPQAPGGWVGSLVSSNEMVASDFEAVFRARLEPPELLWERPIKTTAAPVFTRDLRWVALSESNRVLVLDAVTGQTIRELVVEGEAPQHLAFFPDATRLVGTHRDLPVSVWRMTDGALEFTLPGVDQIVTGLAISPDGRALAASHARGISLWDMQSRQGPEDLTALPSVVYSVAVSRNGLVAVGSGLGHVAVFELVSGRRLRFWKPGTNGRALALAPSGEWLVTQGANEATLSVHRLPEGVLERSVSIPRGRLERLELSAAGDRLAIQPQEGGPMVVQTADWTLERSFELPRGDWMRAMRLSPDGQRLAAVWSDRSVQVWRVHNGEVIGTLPPEYSGFLEWHDAGERLWLLSSAGRVTRWNVTSGEIEADRMLPLEGANIVRVLWLPDRSVVLLSLSDIGLELWRLDRMERVARFEEEVGRACYAMASSPGGDRLLLGRYDATLAVVGLPFFLESRPGDAGEAVFTARGPVGPVRWEIRGEDGDWAVVPGQTGAELVLPATELQGWVRAALGP